MGTGERTLADAAEEAEELANEALRSATRGEATGSLAIAEATAAVAYEIRALRMTLSPLIFLARPTEHRPPSE